MKKAQRCFHFERPERKNKTNATIARDYDQANLECAREILRGVDRYGGDDAFPAIWAAAVIERLERKVAA